MSDVQLELQEMAEEICEGFCRFISTKNETGKCWYIRSGQKCPLETLENYIKGDPN